MDFKHSNRVNRLLDDAAIAQRVLDHIDNQTTDLGRECLSEPVANYRSTERLQRELSDVFRNVATPFCPSAALAKHGDFVARDAAGVPLIAVRGQDGIVKAFRNACRHRGAQLAQGEGHKNSFVCPYHGWTYGLDGALRHIPHEHGFPGLDKATHGLVPVAVREHGGLVFIHQRGADSDFDALADIPALLTADLELIATSERINEANWKIVAEGFLEGYHIYPTHRDTFYPVQFDNLNVIEHFARNSRVTFPYRNIQKLRDVEPAGRRVAGTLTHVYHLFPNVMVATFPHRTIVAVLEPQGVAATKVITYTLAALQTVRDKQPAIVQDTQFVDAGAEQDRAVVQSIQRGLATEANEVFEFGRFEAAIVHMHQNLHAMLDAPLRARTDVETAIG